MRREEIKRKRRMLAELKEKPSLRKYGDSHTEDSKEEKTVKKKTKKTSKKKGSDSKKKEEDSNK